MELATPYAVTNILVPSRDAVSRREAQRMDEAVVDPSKTLSKQHAPKAIPKMGISTAIIHHMTMDFE